MSTFLSTAERLFLAAVRVLHHAGIPLQECSLGGGTALAMRYGHRNSRDVDLFFHDAQWVCAVSPRLNTVAEQLASNYDEVSNFVKLYLPEGQIDFIVSPHLTLQPFSADAVWGKPVKLESPEEVIVKKLYHRAALLKVRDIVDTAVVLQDPCNTLSSQERIIRPRLEAIRGRIHRLSDIYENEVRQLDITDEYMEFALSAPGLVLSFLKTMDPVRNRTESGDPDMDTER